MVEKTYPSQVAVEHLRSLGYTCRVAWESRGPKGIAWITCYSVWAPDGAWRAPIIVQTFGGGREDHWQVWVPASDTVQIDGTLKQLVAYLERHK